jgi:cytochrome b
MNTTSSPTQPSSTPIRLRVWDLPTRVFHWLLVLLVIGLILSGNLGGEWMMWHARFGYGVLALLLFRLIWGVVGGHHSRFAHFLPSVATLRAALATAWRGPHQPSIGHNPLGALSVVAMLLVLTLQVGSGLISDDEIAFSGPLSAQVSTAWVTLATWYHKAVGKRLLIALVVLHVLAMVYYRRRHGEALITAMVVGDKTLGHAHVIHPVASQDGWRERLGALLVLGVCVSLVYLLVQWGGSA